MLQATLTLPGIAAIALTLGMAIDANVLINERIREELRWGATPHAAIQAGYERAWDTILDSERDDADRRRSRCLIFGTGPVRGFAVVHCLGILTSMFSAVFVSRGIVAPDLRRPQEARRASRSARCWQPGRRRRRRRCRPSRSTRATPHPRDRTWNSSASQRDIPFMRHALVFNVISLVTFVLAVIFLAITRA